MLLTIIEDGEISSRMQASPAETRIHHAFIGGLLEHIVSLCRMAALVQQNYPWINIDLLLAGVILHDIGKIHELAYERAFRYTEVGRLTGHIGLKIVRAAIDTGMQVSPGVALALEHLVLSHHGELQYGSPVQPLLPEAIMLHHLDNLDARMAGIKAAVDKAPLTAWTEKVPGLERQILRTEYLLDPASDKP